MNILVTGSNGQLGSELKIISKGYFDHSFLFTDVDELDITDSQKLLEFFEKNEIDAVINCAAYTAVDKAEAEKDLAFKINALAVENLVKACEEYHAKLVHISTDYVFNGEYFKPLAEIEKVEPLGVYGLTKREGETIVVNSSIDGIVIRTSWLYSSFGNNFVKTMLRLGVERESLGIIYDQIGTPTYAADLAVAIMNIISSGKRMDTKGEVYHYSNEGVASWYDFAKAIFELADIDCVVNPIETSEYPTPASRPHYSVMNKAKIKGDFNISIPYWRESLEKCIKVLQRY